MKRFFISMLLVSFLGFNATSAYASSETTTTENQVEAGITPDSFLYSIDKLFEEINLKLASSTEEEAKLLLQYAQERLAETKTLIENNEEELVKTTVTDYIDTLEAAEDKIVETAANEDVDDIIKEDLADTLNTATEISEEIEPALPDELKEQVSEKTDTISITAKVVAGIDVDVVKSLREKQLGYGQIAHIVALSQASGKSIEEISELVINKEKGFGEIARELGLHPSKMKYNNKTNEKDETTTDATEPTETSSEIEPSTDETNAISEAGTKVEDDKQTEAMILNVAKTSTISSENIKPETKKEIKDKIKNDTEKSKEKQIKDKNIKEQESKEKELKEKAEKNKEMKENKNNKKEKKNQP